jgi:hypothetical protein
VPTQLLLYTAQAEHDVLGHAIARIERGTFTHAALYRDGVIVEAVYPKVHRVDGAEAQKRLAGATRVVDLEPIAEELDKQVWQDLVAQMVGQSYSLSTLVSDAASSLLGHEIVNRFGGTVVCSSLACKYAQLIHDRRVPTWRDSDSVTPADLGQMFLGKRAPHP